MKYSSSKDINALVRALIRQNWSFVRGGKHGKLVGPSGHPALTVPGSPSDCRAFLNFKRDVIRAEPSDCRAFLNFKRDVSRADI